MELVKHTNNFAYKNSKVLVGVQLHEPNILPSPPPQCMVLKIIVRLCVKIVSQLVRAAFHNLVPSRLVGFQMSKFSAHTTAFYPVSKGNVDQCKISFPLKELSVTQKCALFLSLTSVHSSSKKQPLNYFWPFLLKLFCL